jgi:threonine dehydrogenase-like Zn-dependent dehydrogenase
MGCPDELPGALAGRLVMPAECFYKVPDSMTLPQAVMVEPLSIAVWAAQFAGEATGKTIAILGTGTMGLCTLLALRAAGEPRRVYASDLIDDRLAMARKLGAFAAANAARQDVAKEFLAAEPLGFDYVFECAGQQETLDQAAKLLAPGGTLIIVGIPETDRISFDMSFLRRKELKVQNVRRQNGTVARTIDLVASGKADVDPLATHYFPLERTADAFELAHSYKDGVIKAIVEL